MEAERQAEERERRLEKQLANWLVNINCKFAMSFMEKNYRKLGNIVIYC